jgi:hypothetical protein
MVCLPAGGDCHRSGTRSGCVPAGGDCRRSGTRSGCVPAGGDRHRSRTRSGCAPAGGGIGQYCHITLRDFSCQRDQVPGQVLRPARPTAGAIVPRVPASDALPSSSYAPSALQPRTAPCPPEQVRYSRRTSYPCCCQRARGIQWSVTAGQRCGWLSSCRQGGCQA